MPRSSALLLSLVLASPAFAQQPAKPRSPQKSPAAPKTGPDLPSNLPKDAPVCVVDGVRIPLSVYVDRLSLRFGPEVRETLIQEALLRKEAARRNVTVTPAELEELVRKSYTDAVRRYGSEKALAKELDQSRGWSAADFKAVLRDQAQVPALRNKLAATLVPPSAIKDEEISKRYQEQKSAFALPDTVRIAHILIKRPADGGDDDAARKRAEALLQQVVQANGANFEQLAREKSEDPATAARGGKIPVEIPRGANPFGAAFEATVYNSPVGLVREVISAPDGYHVVRVDAKQEARTLPLAEVKEQVRGALLAEKRDQAVDELLTRLRREAKISTGKF